MPPGGRGIAEFSSASPLLLLYAISLKENLGPIPPPMLLVAALNVPSCICMKEPRRLEADRKGMDG